jgi:hypothetical protein
LRCRERLRARRRTARIAAHACQRPIRGRVHLLDRPAACPDGDADCLHRRRAFLIEGNVVLAGAERGGFRCVHFIAPSGQASAGFVASAALGPVPDSKAPLAPEALLGTRRFRGRQLGPNIVVIARAPDGTLYAAGDAAWASGQAGEVNVGHVEGVVEAQGDGFVVWDGECEVQGLRRGPYLALRDNLRCGGLNVSFLGLYAREGR